MQCLWKPTSSALFHGKTLTMCSDCDVQSPSEGADPPFRKGWGLGVGDLGGGGGLGVGGWGSGNLLDTEMWSTENRYEEHGGVEINHLSVFFKM